MKPILTIPLAITTVCLMMWLVYDWYWVHPEMTEPQFLWFRWPWYLVGIVLACVTIVVGSEDD